MSPAHRVCGDESCKEPKAPGPSASADGLLSQQEEKFPQMIYRLLRRHPLDLTLLLFSLLLTSHDYRNEVHIYV